MTGVTAIRPRREQGPRETRRQARRRARRRRMLLAGGAVCAVAVLVGLAVSRVSGEPETLPPPVADQTNDPLVAPLSLLLIGHPGDGGMATSVTLLVSGPAGATVLFVPTGVLADIPGFGQDLLGAAHRYGGADLVRSTIVNLTGARIDQTAAISDARLAGLFDRAGGLEVEVTDRLVTREAAGQASVRFRPGTQFLNGARLAEYWTFRDPREDELVAFGRRRAVLEALLERIGADDGALDRLLAGGGPFVTEASPDELEAVLDGLATAHAAGRLTMTLLPVEPFGGGGPDGEPTYRIREEEAAELVEGLAAPGRSVEEVIRVQVLNGVGVPGVGQTVDALLAEGRFRIVLTGNARSFEFDETQILVYDETPPTLTAARRMRDLLGVGRIAVSRQPQSVVDLTVVVGADLVEIHGEPQR